MEVTRQLVHAHQLVVLRRLRREVWARHVDLGLKVQELLVGV